MLEVLGSHSYQPTYQMNLLVNSRDPMPEGDRLTIRAENIYISDRNAKMNLDAKVGAYTLLIQGSASRRK